MSLVTFVQDVAAPLAALVDALAPALAAADHQPLVPGNIISASFAISAGLIAGISILLATWMRARLALIKHSLREERARSRTEISFLEMLLGSGPQGLVVMRGEEQERFHFGNGRLFYDRLLDGPQASRLVKALDGLKEDGEDFTLCLQDKSDSAILVRGTAVAGRAVVYLCEQEMLCDRGKYAEILDALPMPVWTRNDKAALEWANAAFLRAVGIATLGEARASNVSLDKVEEAANRAWSLPSGGRRIFECHLAPVDDVLTAGIAVDMTDRIGYETEMRLTLDAHADMIDHFPFAIAVFGTDRKLTRHNRAYAEMWGLSEAWLDGAPSFEDILVQLRDKRRIPEQRNFAEWKKAQLEAFDGRARQSEQTWHLPRGKSMRILTWPHLQGGLVLLCEDISERLRLEASLKLLTQVQKATLDTLNEGVAIFGTDGRLVLHNALFAKMWKLDEDELTSQPHFAEISNLCAARIGRDGIWGIVSCGIISAAAEGVGEWGRARRADGRIFSLSLSRLPNGATVVTFADITDLQRFSALQESGKAESKNGDAAA